MGLAAALSLLVPTNQQLVSLALLTPPPTSGTNKFLLSLHSTSLLSGSSGSFDVRPVTLQGNPGLGAAPPSETRGALAPAVIHSTGLAAGGRAVGRGRRRPTCCADNDPEGQFHSNQGHLLPCHSASRVASRCYFRVLPLQLHSHHHGSVLGLLTDLVDLVVDL